MPGVTGRMLWQPSGRGTEAAHAMDDLQLSALRRCRATVSTAPAGKRQARTACRGCGVVLRSDPRLGMHSLYLLYTQFIAMLAVFPMIWAYTPGSMVLADGDLGPGIGAVLAARHDQACTQPDLPRHAGSESKLRSTQALGTGTGIERTWRARRDSNPDQWLRKPLLYPAELRARCRTAAPSASAGRASQRHEAVRDRHSIQFRRTNLPTGKALPEGQEYPIAMADTLTSPQSPATPRWRHYWSLMRADRPIGTLLLWPTWWALWLAAGGLPPLWTLFVFTAGVWLTRSAGCVINDYADRWLDPHVERTRRGRWPPARSAVAPRWRCSPY